MSEPMHSRQPVQYRGVVDGRLLELELVHRRFRTPHARLRIDGELIPERERKTPDDVTAPTGVFWTREHDEGLQLHVHRPGQDEAAEGDRAHERIEVRSRSLGRAAEVDVRLSAWGSKTALLAEDGSRSAQRDASLRAHPYRRAVQRGVWTSLKYIVPLLGLREIVDRVTQPAQEAAEDAVRPTATWIAQLLEPIGRLFGAIADVIGALFGWVVPVLQFLFGWVPPLLGWLPDWSFGPFLSVIIILLSALGAYQEGKQRSARLQDQEEALRAHLRARVARGVRQVMGRREGPDPPGAPSPVRSDPLTPRRSGL